MDQVMYPVGCAPHLLEMDAESHAGLLEFDLLYHWVYIANENHPNCLDVHLGRGVNQPQLDKVLRKFKIRTQCESVSVRVPGLLYFKAGIPEFANPFRVTRQLFLPELPGGLASIIERYADAWTIQHKQFRALLDTAFHVRNVTYSGPLLNRFLGSVKMDEVGECLCFRFTLGAPGLDWDP